jgi:hypothetical protein
MTGSPTALLALLFISHFAAAEEWQPLFNGKDLSGWDGDPTLWKVENGIIIGTCAGPEAMQHNSFLIWQGGSVKDFELQVTLRVKGDNNSGIQYRSRLLPEVGPWAITGYQHDVHPALEHTGMTYEEKGRGIFGLNGTKVAVDAAGALWRLSTHQPVSVDVTQWNDYTIIARGEHLVHQVNGQVTSELMDYDVTRRALDGLVAIQLHRGNANTVEIKQVRLRHLPVVAPVPVEDVILPASAIRIEKPMTSRPQGTGKPALPAQGKTQPGN